MVILSFISFFLDPPFADLCPSVDSPVQLSLSVFAVTTSATVLFSVGPAQFSFVLPSTATAPQVVRSPFIVRLPSSPGILDVPSSASSFLTSQLPRVVSSRTLSAVTLEATITSGVILSWQKTTLKRQRDDAHEI